MAERVGGSSVVERAYDALLAYVDEAAAGARLPPERSLAISLGISRSTLRTAVDRLVRLGFLEVRHGAGTVVKRPDSAALALPYREVVRRSPASTAQLSEIRRILEPRLAGLAARRRTDAEASSIVSLAAQSGPDFYVAVARASKNDIAAELVAFLVSLAAAPGPDESMGELWGTGQVLRHQRTAVAAAIAASEPSPARETMAAHMRSLARAIASEA